MLELPGKKKDPVKFNKEKMKQGSGNDAILSVSGLTKSYGDLVAVDDLYV